MFSSAGRDFMPLVKCCLVLARFFASGYELFEERNMCVRGCGRGTSIREYNLKLFTTPVMLRQLPRDYCHHRRPRADASVLIVLIVHNL